MYKSNIDPNLVRSSSIQEIVLAIHTEATTYVSLLFLVAEVKTDFDIGKELYICGSDTHVALEMVI